MTFRHSIKYLIENGRKYDLPKMVLVWSTSVVSIKKVSKQPVRCILIYPHLSFVMHMLHVSDSQYFKLRVYR